MNDKEKLELINKLLEQTRDICPECDGRGWRMHYENNGPTSTDTNISCPVCHGARKTEPHPNRIVVL